MSTSERTFVEELGDALREVRWRRRLSQRALAQELGTSKSWVGRMESGDVPGSLLMLARLVAALGISVAVTVDDVTTEGEEDAALRDTPVASAADGHGVAPVGAARSTHWSPPFEQDDAAVALVERWRERARREEVRDAAGRRLPAHLVGYPMSYPHHWWFVRHHGWSLRRRPIWSFTHHAPRAAAVLQVGENPPPLGLHPEGGWPLQGRPSPEVRAAWPPTFPVRPRRYPWPLSAA